MAITKILARKGRLDVGIRYVLNGDKTQEQILTAHLNCEPGRELRQMLETKSQYSNLYHCDRDGVYLYIDAVSGQLADAIGKNEGRT